ncbi:MAG: molybdopterin molybdotransferase MoeA [Rubripirellula sp.]
MTKKFAYDHPDDALRALASHLHQVEVEASVKIDDASIAGRVLAQDILADRDSPAADVSAMDGYAIRMNQIGTQEIAVTAESVPGSPPPTMQEGGAVRIFTGAIVPKGAEAVVKREDTEEREGAILLRASAMGTQVGEHIRRAGENAIAGSTVLQRGRQIDAASLATMTNFGCFETDVHHSVSVSILTTGDEVGLFTEEQPKPWQLRNSNRFSLSGVLANHPSLNVIHLQHCHDNRESLTKMLDDLVAESDAVILTGGVSMGDYDYVPDVVREVGGEVIFHGLPIRPGKPILGAATSSGKLIVGLPGNPVSASIGCKRMVLPLLAKISGKANWLAPCPVVRLQNGGTKTIPLHWMQLVRLTKDGVCEPVISKGSGDLVSLGQSDGFVELPPGAVGEGPWPFYSWS